MCPSSSGFDMSTFIRRYSRYLNEKAFAYRQMSFDFIRVKKGYAFPFHAPQSLTGVSPWGPSCVWEGSRCLSCASWWFCWTWSSWMLFHRQTKGPVGTEKPRKGRKLRVAGAAADSCSSGETLRRCRSVWDILPFLSSSVSALRGPCEPCRWRSCWRECPFCRARSTLCWILKWATAGFWSVLSLNLESFFLNYILIPHLTVPLGPGPTQGSKQWSHQCLFPPAL